MLITPKTKIGELLEAFPQLEPVLMDLAPAFKKLKNPVLRKTIGRVATLQQAASVGGLSVSELVNALRAEAGQELFSPPKETGDINYQEPGWFDPEKVSIRFEATPLINSGQNPMQEVFRRLDKLEEGGLFLLVTPFLPAPIIELITHKGYDHYCMEANRDEFHTFFIRKPVPG